MGHVCNDRVKLAPASDRKAIGKFGGASRDRTDDLIVANDALSQLSYSPIGTNLLRGSV